MRLELKDIKDRGLRQEIDCAAADFPVIDDMQAEGDIGFEMPIHFQLRFQKSGQLVEVDGDFKTTVSLSCARCLQAYEKVLESDFAFTFTPYVEDKIRDDEEEVELETDELGLVFYKDDCLELKQPLQDQLVMALPISPLCSEDCKGLCAECGGNLNDISCSCEKKIFNSKFSALAGLKIDSSKQ